MYAAVTSQTTRMSLSPVRGATSSSTSLRRPGLGHAGRVRAREHRRHPRRARGMPRERHRAPRLHEHAERHLRGRARRSGARRVRALPHPILTRNTHETEGDRGAAGARGERSRAADGRAPAAPRSGGPGDTQLVARIVSRAKAGKLRMVGDGRSWTPSTWTTPRRRTCSLRIALGPGLGVRLGRRISLPRASRLRKAT